MHSARERTSVRERRLATLDILATLDMTEVKQRWARLISILGGVTRERKPGCCWKMFPHTVAWLDKLSAVKEASCNPELSFFFRIIQQTREENVFSARSVVGRLLRLCSIVERERKREREREKERERERESRSSSASVSKNKTLLQLCPLINVGLSGHHRLCRSFFPDEGRQGKNCLNLFLCCSSSLLLHSLYFSSAANYTRGGRSSRPQQTDP
jgi:hypothetical protein